MSETGKKIRYTFDHGIRTVVRAEDSGFDPAAHAAGILARREYGRAARVGPVRLDSWSKGFGRYEAFIGRRASDGNGIAGHNVWIDIWDEAV